MRWTWTPPPPPQPLAPAPGLDALMTRARQLQSLQGLPFPLLQQLRIERPADLEGRAVLHIERGGGLAHVWHGEEEADELACGCLVWLYV